MGSFRIAIDPDKAEAKSRLVLIALTTMTLRLMERWRHSISTVLGTMPDYETAMIVGAIVSISADKLTRAKLATDLESLRTAYPRDLLTKCNVASIAAATGLNRETTRRKVKELIKARFVIKEGDSLYLAHGMLQLPVVRETVNLQLETLRRTVSQLGDMDVVRPARR